MDAGALFSGVLLPWQDSQESPASKWGGLISSAFFSAKAALIANKTNPPIIQSFFICSPLCKNHLNLIFALTEEEYNHLTAVGKCL
jgi:hypothetical protein